MKFDPTKHHRRSIRLKGYDYTQPGAYFITICTYQRECCLGDILDGEMVTNQFGKIAYDEWFKTAEIRKQVQLHADEFSVMPNHVHGIIWLIETEAGAGCQRIPTQEKFGKPISGSIPTIVRSYKAAVTRRINWLLGSPGVPVWQRNYYEHIIRNGREHKAIQRYILENPLKWHLDRDYPQ
jgi:REP element-mobilizing transposase RayT